MHKETSSLVQASAQSMMMRAMQEELTDEERAVYKRGRNAKSVSPAKNQSITDYRRATGFEALIGYLYLKEDWKRMLDLVKIGLDSLEKEEEMLAEDIEALIEERQAARKERNFQRADEIRDELLKKGIILEDTREGVKWKKA